MKLWVDEGHGGADSGAVGGGYKEDSRNLTLGNEIERLARLRGWAVMSTRDIDIFVELATRYTRANAMPADVMVSIHHDWIGGRQAVIYPDSNDAREVKSSRLSDVINDRIDALAPTTSIIYADRRGLAVLRGTKMPAAIIEVARVQDPYNVSAMAQAIVNGIAVFMGEASSPVPAPLPPEVPDVQYRLIAGWADSPAARLKVEKKCVELGVRYTADGPAFEFHASLDKTKLIEAVIAADPALHRFHGVRVEAGTHTTMGVAKGIGTRQWAVTVLS